MAATWKEDVKVVEQTGARWREDIPKEELGGCDVVTFDPNDPFATPKCKGKTNK